MTLLAEPVRLERERNCFLGMEGLRIGRRLFLTYDVCAYRTLYSSYPCHRSQLDPCPVGTRYSAVRVPRLIDPTRFALRLENKPVRVLAVSLAKR